MRGLERQVGRRRFWLALALMLMLQALLAVALFFLQPDSRPAAVFTAYRYWLFSAWMLLSAALVIVWLVLDRLLFVPLAAVTRGAETMAGPYPGHLLEVRRGHWLGDLPRAVTGLGSALEAARDGRDEAFAGGDPTDHKMALERLLNHLPAGIIVADGEGRILLYNEAARHVLRDQPALGLGREVAEVLAERPLRSALLRRRRGRGPPDQSTGTSFVCATADASRLLQCRLILLDEGEGARYVVTLEDRGMPTPERMGHERRMREAVDALRAPLAGLCAASTAAEAAGDEPTAEARFRHIVNEEAVRLVQRFKVLAGEAEALLAADWRLADVHSGDLVAGVLAQEPDDLPKVTMGDEGEWLRGEGYLLERLLANLLRRLRAELKVAQVRVDAALYGPRVYLDLCWLGRAVPPAQLAGWLESPVEDTGGNTHLGEILERHDAALWSRIHPRRPQEAMLRLPLPAAERDRSTVSLPPRPAFYDFRIGERVATASEEAGQSLSDLDCVVFDTETTGLEPSQGDEIVSIGAIRVTGGRPIHGEVFDTLVNPGRPIPEASRRFHGIDDEHVRDAPDITTTLRRFRAFVGDAVLVAHSAAFDMRFLELKERRSGVRFDRPVLDTLLLSMLVYDHSGDHSLEAIAGRLGVPVTGRHTALGDAVTTAEIFVRLLPLLRGRGIRRLEQADAACRRLAAYRMQQRAF